MKAVEIFTKDFLAQEKEFEKDSNDKPYHLVWEERHMKERGKEFYDLPLLSFASLSRKQKKFKKFGLNLGDITIQ